MFLVPVCGLFNSDRFTFSTHHDIMSLPLCGFFNSGRFAFSTHNVIIILPLCGFFSFDQFTFSTHHRGAVPGTNWLHGGEHSAVWTSSDPVKDYDSGLVGLNACTGTVLLKLLCFDVASIGICL